MLLSIVQITSANLFDTPTEIEPSNVWDDFIDSVSKLVPGAITSTTTNGVSNPGFESGVYIPENWEFVYQDTNSVWDNIGHSGFKSVKINVPGTSDKISGYPISKRILVRPNTQYTLSAWGKSLNAGGTNNPAVRAIEADIYRTSIKQNSIYFDKGTTNWVQKSITFTTSSKTYFIYVYANIWKGYGTFWVDDISLLQTSSNPTVTATPTPTSTTTPRPTVVTPTPTSTSPIIVTPTPTPTVTTTQPPTTTSQFPYAGVISIPGTIQIENYDAGGEGVSYHDLDTANQGNQYRNDAVDIESASEGGYNVGWMLAGEWLEYTVNVQTAGTYTINSRVASNEGGGTYHIEFNGVDKTGQITITSTGGWQNWVTLSNVVTLNAGQQVMRIVMDGNALFGLGSLGNMNYISISSGGISNPPVVPPTPTTTTPTTIVSGAFYVATNGNDNNPGTEAQPWRTIQKAADTLTAGHTVYVKDGVYNEKVTIKNSGTSNGWINFISLNRNGAVIDGTNINMGTPPDYGLVTSLGMSYIKISGFKIQNSGQYGMDIRGPFTDVLLENNYIYNTQAAGMTVTGGSGGNLGNSFNLVIDGNTFDRSHTRNIMGDGHEGMSVSEGVTNFEIKNNYFLNSDMGLIDVKNGVFNGLIHDNLCTTSDYSCVYTDGYYYGANNIKIYKNIVRDMTANEFDDAVSGFVVSSEQTTGNTYDIYVYNNLVYRNAGDCFYVPAYLQGQLSNVHFTSNVCYRNGYNPSDNNGRQYRGGAVIDAGNNIYVRNNLFVDNYDLQIWNSIGSRAIIENNLIYGFRGRYAQEIKGVSYIESDPFFMNPALGDFHLQSNSPAINKGSSSSFVPSIDYDSKSRPIGVGYDIGAFER